MKERIKETIRDAGRAISDYVEDNDREIVGFLRGVEMFLPFTAIGIIAVIADHSKHPRKYFSKSFIEKILNDKEEG